MALDQLKKTSFKVVGTRPTRPDGIDHESIHYLRSLGVTRMQIGIQHTNNELLKIVNRGHTIEDSIRALKLLKDSGIKVICHLMPDLPYATKEQDIEILELESVLVKSNRRPKRSLVSTSIIV